MATQFITGIFKLHNPSTSKKKVLDHVFEAYTLGMTDLLELGQQNLDLLRDWGRVTSKTKTGIKAKDKFQENTITPLLPGSGQIDLPIAACLKEALLSDVGSLLASHLSLELIGEEAGFPSARDPSPEGWQNVLEDFALVSGDVEDENESKKRLLRRARGSVMPVHFARSRDFTLLVDKNKGRFFAWLKLLPAKHYLGKETVIDQGNLVDMNTGEVFKKKSSTSFLLPVSLGRRNDDWHWQYNHFILPLMSGQAKVKAAKLVKEEARQGVDYYLHVSFAFDCPELYTPQTYLGVDRGVFFSMAYGIVGKDGSIIKMAHKDDGFRHERIAAGKRVQVKQARGKSVTVKDYRQKQLDSILHVVINDIIDKAIAHKSMIVLEDLNIKIKGKFYKSAWRKMHKMLEYKCKLAGVPIWKGGIWAAYSSQICIVCGERNKGRKRDWKPFECPDCGAVYHSDEGAGINIARRVMYRKKDWKGKGGYWAFHKSFANEADFGTKIDLRKQMRQLEFAI